MEDVGILFGHLAFFTSIWCIVLPFGMYMLWLVGIFFQFWCVVPRKIWQP
jgi:hypothetical protein